ncbi:heavy metal translocating P-type ATPase [Thermus scotoductus]|uniref:Heavy metal translocating P-type ATPase n=6 Tax=Thermus scotoductus TaxID=37636 RepID=A0A430SC73_THESC|nr:cation-translocating P-type ATPase [Thermus scotoductus]RTG95867.1 heavy metal translocating P-type ATPase [Thermus scotoductus]RTH07871.1 heavy metal translocating P-type ATPase [Thermus scotoductus]RTH09587.1 heavy metal translocating P-type ATPase [Thermus scotoductus]RTH12236.1 heavy metal translocating P-type ATPase [Thermus scotoductus]RTH16508.1 heavy metal translocating P-type ATPase [Thermus scotoductus]
MEAHRVRVFRVEGLDCADCALKVEKALSGVPGVVQAQVSFASGKAYLHLEVPGAEKEAERVVSALGYRLKPEGDTTRGVLGPWRWALASGGLLLAAFLASLFLPGLAPWGYRLAALVGVFPLARRAVAAFRQNPFSMQSLVTLATLGALAIGAEAEAAVVVFLFLVGEVLEAYSVAQARRSLYALSELLPRRAYRLKEGGVEEVPLKALRVGDLVRVPPGERVPADGVVVSGQASVEEAAFTGEPLPRPKGIGDRVYGGSLVQEGSLVVKVERLPEEGFLAEMERLAEGALLKKSQAERVVDAFSRRYTPAVLALAGFVGLVLPLFRGDFLGHVYKALGLLLIACPCALVVSVPAAIAAGVARGARAGVLFKSGAALERLAGVRYVALDKTGTLTLGKPTLVRVVTFGVSTEEALALAKGVAEGSSHPLARAVREASGPKALPSEEHRAVPGLGAFARVEGKEVGLVRPEAWDLPPEVEAQVKALTEEGFSLSLLVREGVPLALLAFQDTPRLEAREVLAELRRLGLKPLLLTGDRETSALALGTAIGLFPEEIRAGLSPVDKLRLVEELAGRGGVAMVGDGVNDAPALARATVGLAVAEGTEAALQSADVGLLSLAALPRAFRLSRLTLGVVRQNVAFAVGLKGLFLLTTLMGYTGLWTAVLADSGALVLVTANSLRLLRRRV